MIKKITIFIGIVLIFIIGILIGSYLSKNSQEAIQNVPVQSSLRVEGYREIPIVGVDDKGKGVTGILSAEVKSGSGLVLVNINNVLADYLTQISARNAAKVAETYTGKSLANLDIIYNIKANASVIEGPSAGAVMAVGTIAALENKNIKSKVFMTGAIDISGEIVPVSGIVEKASAAKQAGAELFLIPSANYVQGFEKQEACTTYRQFEYCEIIFKPTEANISQVLGIAVKEVKNINETINYFIEK